MAFGGVAVFTATGRAARGNWRNRIQITGLTLAGRAGAFGVAAADSGRLTTDQTPPANETAIVSPAASTFGPRPTFWVANDERDIDVQLYPSDDAALVGGANASSDVQVIARRVNTGELELDFKNRGAGAFAGTIMVTWSTTLTH